MLRKLTAGALIGAVALTTSLPTTASAGFKHSNPMPKLHGHKYVHHMPKHHYPKPPTPPKPPQPPQQPQQSQQQGGRGGHSPNGAALYVAGVTVCGATTLLATAAYKAHTEKSELTLREAHTAFWGCALPIIGPYVFNSLYDQYGWSKYETVKPVIRRKAVVRARG
jgi:hypothetical protein